MPLPSALPMRRPASALALLLACLSAGCAGGTTPAASNERGTVQVVALENTWGDIARQLGGKQVRVTSVLTDPSADPHTYDADPATAASLGTADLVIENGLGYDAFADKLLSAAGGSRTVLDIAKAVGATAQANPHLWYDPASVTAGAKAMATALTRADPAHAKDYQAGLSQFLGSYARYPAVLGKIKASHAGAPVSYTERVPGYLLTAAGLRLATPASFAQAVEDGNDPSAADTDAIDRAMTDKTVKVLFYNSQVTSPTTARVQALARAHGVPVVGVAETIPGGEPDFQTWQVHQAQAVLTALGG